MWKAAIQNCAATDLLRNRPRAKQGDVGQLLAKGPRPVWWCAQRPVERAGPSMNTAQPCIACHNYSVTAWRPGSWRCAAGFAARQVAAMSFASLRRNSSTVAICRWRTTVLLGRITVTNTRPRQPGGLKAEAMGMSMTTRQRLPPGTGGASAAAGCCAPGRRRVPAAIHNTQSRGEQSPGIRTAGWERQPATHNRAHQQIVYQHHTPISPRAVGRRWCRW